MKKLGLILGLFIIFVIIVVVCIGFVPFIFMLLWNWIMPIFGCNITLTFFEALGICLLIEIIGSILGIKTSK